MNKRITEGEQEDVERPCHEYGPLDDTKLERWLSQRLDDKRRVAVVISELDCFVADMVDDCPRELILADPDANAAKVFKKLARKGLVEGFESLGPIAEGDVIDPACGTGGLTALALADLLRSREDRLGRGAGRGKAASERTAHRVWTDAGGRCMFRGCAKDLTSIPFHTAAARVGYLAHIVASNPSGPRGCRDRSHQLADDPENIMLMCDEHHRLIDVFARDKHDEAMLREMRTEHASLVKRNLDALQYKRCTAIAVLGNVAQVPTHFSEGEYVEALLAVKRSMAPGVVEFVRRKAHRDDRTEPDFWVNYLREHEGAIRVMVEQFKHDKPFDTDEVGVFALHHVSTLVLAGRITGEAMTIHLFHRDRHRATWAWDSAREPRPRGFFRSTNPPEPGRDEVLISLELTSAIDQNAIPPNIRERIDAGTLPWIRISAGQPSSECIGHPDDVTQFAAVARPVIAHVQDGMRVKKVHLMCVAPPTALFKFGQMMQAGHHPPYVVYDRPNGEVPFRPALTITGNAVSAANGDNSHTIPLR